MGRNRLPDRWLPYIPIGKVVPGTRFLACKVPLKQSILRQLPEHERFGPQDLIRAVPNLGLLVDLTNTTRYYSKQEIMDKKIQYEKILCPGHEVPLNSIVKRFFSVVDTFLGTHRNNDAVIAVHCTHGVNRTGYFICRYMIQKMNIPPDEAVKKFQQARGHAIEREYYVDDLRKWCKGGVESNLSSSNDFPQVVSMHKQYVEHMHFNGQNDSRTIMNKDKEMLSKRWRYDNPRDGNVRGWTQNDEKSRYLAEPSNKSRMNSLRSNASNSRNDQWESDSLHYEYLSTQSAGFKPNKRHYQELSRPQNPAPNQHGTSPPSKRHYQELSRPPNLAPNQHRTSLPVFSTMSWTPDSARIKQNSKSSNSPTHWRPLPHFCYADTPRDESVAELPFGFPRIYSPQPRFPQPATSNAVAAPEVPINVHSGFDRIRSQQQSYRSEKIPRKQRNGRKLRQMRTMQRC